MRQRFPHVLNWGHDAPPGFNHIVALEQGCIPQHAIIQQPLIACTGRAAKIILVLKFHINRSQAHERAGYFCAEI
jgi:hypothetical protein